MKEQFLSWLNRLLVFDVFLVIAGFFWFAIAVMGRSLGINLGFDLWYQLWQPVFNPAIGILFLGAFLSWGINKLSQKLTTK
jgi:predicted permease